jgi:serine/threonine-protein kinase HipA
VRDGQDVVFSYRADYLADPGPAVARTLPLKAAPVRTPAGAVPPFFAGLLPEGARLRAVVAGTRTSEDDHLTLLLAVGADTIGDVRVVPEGAVPVEPLATVAEEDIGSVRLADVFARAVSPDPLDLERIALPGVQAKVSASMVSAPVVTSVGPAILKLNPERDHPRLVENEQFFLSMAGACGLTVPDHRLVVDRDGFSGLLVARFDRVVGPGGIRRLAQEDGCQLLGAYPAAKYRLKTERIATAVAAAAEEGYGSAPLALRDVLLLVAFSYLIGNGDLHAKNFSAALRADGAWGASPAYDLLSTQPYLGWRDPMALDLYGRANRLDRRLLIESGGRLGLPDRAVNRMLDQLVERAAPWVGRVEEIGMEERPTQLLAGFLGRRIAEIAG